MIQSHRFNPLSLVRAFLLRAALLLGAFPAVPVDASIRVVTYNIDCDTGTSTPQPGLDTVLAGIGNEHLAGNAQPIDVLALQELYFTPATTLNPLLTSLNAIYGAGTYAADPFVGTNTGNTTGNGPNGLIYNTHTIQVLSAVGIGTTGTSGAARQPVRYKLHPIGYPSTADFYIYVSHYKASSGSSNESRRNVEATAIRADADALGPNVHIIYAGDFNLTAGSGEAAYQKLISLGNGQAFDPVNPAETWTNAAPYAGLCTESATTLNARFDFLMITGAVLNQPGLQLVSGSYTAFGNNGSTAFGGNVSAASNTALSDLANRTQVLSLLTTVTDHLPVVADFNIVGLTPPPAPTGVGASTNPVCQGSGTMLSATVPAGQTVDWFTASCGGTAVGSGTSLAVSPTVNTTYYARARVTATGEVGNACGSVAVTLAQPITMSQQPVDAAVCPSGVAVFTAAGTGAPAYQWQWQQPGSQQWTDVVEGVNMLAGVPQFTAQGSVTGTLTLSALRYANVHWVNVHRARVTNACGSVYSSPANLYIDPSDLGGQGGTPGVDGLHDNNDFVVFINLFFIQDPRADLGKQGGQIGPDGLFDNNDFVVFIAQFFGGC